MMHLDTSYLVDLLRETGRNRPGPATAFLRTVEGDELGISVYVACELFAGAELSRRPSRELLRVQALCDALHVEYPDERFAPKYGRLVAWQERAHQRVSTMDLLIATTAILAEAPLVTRNVKDFYRVPELKLAPY